MTQVARLWLLAAIFLGATILSLAPGAQASPIIFFGEDDTPGGTVPAGGNAKAAHDSFVAALTAGNSVENFESMAVASPLPSPTPLTFTGGFGTLNATLEHTGIIDLINTPTPSSTFATSGTNYLYGAGTGIAFSNFFRLTFSSGITAFGFYGTDIDRGEQLTIGLATVGHPIQNFGVFPASALLPNSLPDGSLFFWAVINATAFDLVLVSNGNDADFFGVDDLTVGGVAPASATPLPAALPLFATGLGALGLLGWRRRRKAAVPTA